MKPRVRRGLDLQAPAVHNTDIARVFAEIAGLLEIQQASPFRIRACRNAARVVEGLQIDLAARLAGESRRAQYAPAGRVAAPAAAGPQNP